LSKIHLLAFSDIHNNVKSVQKLREQEKNNFDAVVVAGDMGDDKAEEVFEIISSFDCPIFYIYGNWDNKLSYDKRFSKNCFHLHQASVSINGFSFAGFSGCKTHWGENPIAETALLDVENSFEEHLKNLENLRKEISALTESLYKEIKNADVLYEQYIKSFMPKKEFENHRYEYLEFLQTKAQYRNDEKAKEFGRIINSNKKKIRGLEKPISQALKSKKHNIYQRAIKDAYKKAEYLNRKLLLEKLKSENCDFSKTFLITHERLFKTHSDAPNLFCHIFGHAHGYKHSFYKGTNFVNVSALDENEIGSYCVINADNSNFEISCKFLPNN